MGAGSSSERRARRQQQQQQQQAQIQTVPQRPAGAQTMQLQQRPGAYPAQQGPPRQMQPPPQQFMPPPPMQQPQLLQPPPGTAAPPSPQAGVSEARSIKNECTVMVESVKYDAAHSLLRFTTNCNIPCEMEVHVAVRVDVMHGNAMITPNKPKAPPPKVPVAAGPAVAHEVPVDLTNVSEQEMKYIQEYPRQFPVVIVLYYTAPDDKTNHCAEYTMVQLLPAGKYVKQLLRTKEGVFKIENLFGGEHADVGTIVGDNHHSPHTGGESPAPEGVTAGVVEDDDEEGLCVICLTNEKTTVVMPCRHLCLCKECAEELRNRSPKCPVCRGPLNQLVSVK